MRAKLTATLVGIALISTSGAIAATASASQEGTNQAADQTQQGQEAQPAQGNGARPARPRVRPRNNFFGLPLLGLVVGTAGGAAALTAGGGNPNSP